MAVATCPPLPGSTEVLLKAKSEGGHVASQKATLLATLPGQSQQHHLCVWEESSQLLTPHHWLLGEGELSARLWTPRLSTEATMFGGVLSLSVWDPEPEPLLTWSVCGTRQVSGVNWAQWSFLSSAVGGGRPFLLACFRLSERSFQCSSED